jgi:hypothetical protein
MSVSYKLVIQNKNKKLLKEELSQFKFKDLTDFTSDMFKLTTNTIQATIVSVGAQIEYSIISSNIKSFADLKSVNEKFRKKLEVAEKLYQDAIPDSVKKDVNLLYNLVNPGAFIAKKLIDSIDAKDTLDNYIPFWWFTKYVFSWNFFKTDVKDFGKLFGVFRFNNIIWFNSFFFRKLLLGNWQTITYAINNGYLSKTGIAEFQSINNVQQLIEKYPKFEIFVRAFNTLNVVTQPVETVTTFASKWDAAKFADYLALATWLKNNPSSAPGYSQKSAEYTKMTKEISADMTKMGVGIWVDLSNMFPNILKSLTGDELAQNIQNYGGDFIDVITGIIKSNLKGLPIIGELFENGTLVIRKNQKILLEDSKDFVNKESNVSRDQLQINALSKDANEAELTVIQNLIDNKKVKTYTSQWLEFIKLTKSVKNKSQKEQASLFFEMLKFSMEYFEKIEGDLKNNLKDLQNSKSEVSQTVNKELNNKFGYELTPKGFAQKLSYDFELLCNLTRISANANLIDIELSLKEFEIICEFLKSEDLENTELMINSFKADMNKKVNFILHDKDINRKFEEIDKSFAKAFDETSRTYEDFKKAQDALLTNLKNSQKDISSILDIFVKQVSEFKKLNDVEKLQQLVELINVFSENIENTVNKIYEKLLPEIFTIKNIFEKDLNEKRLKLKNDFDDLLRKMDQKSFDIIYSDNKASFDKACSKVLMLTGQNKEQGLLFKKLQELSETKKRYEEKLKNFTATLEDQKTKSAEVAKEKQQAEQEKEESAELKINNNIKTINPIKTENN